MYGKRGQGRLLESKGAPEKTNKFEEDEERGEDEEDMVEEKLDEKRDEKRN